MAPGEQERWIASRFFPPNVIALRLPEPLTDRRFEQLCRANPELRLESSARQELIVISPTGSETGLRNSHLIGQLWWWNEQTRLGKVFDSSTGFRLPNGARRSPDAAWIALARWSELTLEQRRRCAPLCPDFVVELRSPSDELAILRNKLQEYLTNGARLGWLIDTELCRIEVYRAGQPPEMPEMLEKPETLVGEDVLPGFVLRLERIWTGD